MSRAHARRSLIAVILVTGSIVVPHAADAAGSQAPLRLVGDKDYPPITYLESGVPKGVDVDVARALAQRMGRELIIDLMDWNEAQQTVLRGEADGLLSMSVTEERQQLYEFTQSTRTHAFGLFVTRGQLVVRGLSDLSGRRVGVTRGGYPRQFLDSRRAATLVPIENYADGFKQLSSGTLDAVAADTWVAAYTVQDRRADDVRLVGAPFATLPAAIALEKHSGLVDQFNWAIGRITADGTLETIVDRWRPHEVVFASRQRLERIVQWSLGGVLSTVVCVSAAWAYALRAQVDKRKRTHTALAQSFVEQRELEKRLIMLAKPARTDVQKQPELRQKVDAMGLLAAGVAHDLNNLLTVIVMTCEEATHIPGVHESARDRFDTIRAAAESAVLLTRRLVILGRRHLPQPRPINLNDVVAQLQRVIRVLLGPDLQLGLRPAADLGRVLADRNQLKHVMLTLAVHARDAMSPGGHLVVETQNVTLDRDDAADHLPIPPGRYVSLAVSVSGIGLDAATRARPLEPFFSTKTGGNATGLALSTVHEIVAESGGFIRVSREPGVGSTFQVYFPRIEDVEAAPPVSDGTSRRRGSGQIILLVEDDLAVLDVMRTYLSRLGYTVLTAADGAEALALCAGLGSPPDLLITEVVMPVTSGPSLAEQLRRTLPHLKVLYVSGYADGPDREGLLPNGAHFVAKPFELSDLAAKIGALLER